MEIDFDGVEQPCLSPRLRDKIADTFRRKLGRHCTSRDAEAWWDWIWPDFEAYWQVKRYRNLSRAILGWAARIREHELDQAVEAYAGIRDDEFSTEQRALNEEAERETQGVVKIDYFSKLGGDAK